MYRRPLISVAPMMDWTDRHERYLLRLIATKILLYTEMIHVGAVLHGERDRHLAYSPEEHPLAIQLGGADPSQLAQCAAIVEEWGFFEINLNVGCPSDRVQHGQFGACLMAQPARVAECVARMQDTVNIPISVKCRTGLDNDEGIDRLFTLVTHLHQVGCDKLIVHARHAWLNGLSPKQNRQIPPLNYQLVYEIKRLFPMMHVTLNGGIQSHKQIQQVLPKVDGVMVGRAAYQQPFLLQEVDNLYYGRGVHSKSRVEVLDSYLDYVLVQQQQFGVPLSAMVRHLFHFFHGVPGAKAWRRYLSDNLPRGNASVATLREAAKSICIEDGRCPTNSHQEGHSCQLNHSLPSSP